MEYTLGKAKELVDQQRKYFLTHTTKDVAFRIQMLKKFKKVLVDNESRLLEAIKADFKKSEFETFTNELFLVYHEIDTAIKKTKRWSAKKSVRTNLANFPSKSYRVPEPLGVALVIGAWNYPYQLSLSPIVPAMAAGCTVVLKPSEIPSATSAVMAEILNANFDARYLAVVEGGIPETTDLLDQKFDKIFFTGSVPVGRIIYQAAAKHLTPVTLELGGKSPAFILGDCNLKMTVKRLVWSKFINSGQTCLAPDYVLVQSSIKKRFLALVKEEIDKTNYAFENDNFIQIINERNHDRLTAMIDRDKVYCGGESDKASRYLAPTIMSDVTFDDMVMQDEIFGPILPVIEFNDLDRAIGKVLELDKPLALYVFTSSSDVKRKILKEVSFGGGGVNDSVMHISNPHLPFGGVGSSGIGAYHDKAGFDEFSHYKSIIEKPTWFELPLKFSPYSERKLNIIKKFFGQ